VLQVLCDLTLAAMALATTQLEHRGTAVLSIDVAGVNWPDSREIGLALGQLRGVTMMRIGSAAWVAAESALAFGPLAEYYASLPRDTAEGRAAEERRAQCDLVRDVFVNPAHPVSVAPEWLRWRGDLVPRMARAIYDERRFKDLPVLADALEEAGCQDAAILGHLRGPGPHTRGCWPVDALLGKK
jgi:hypothetical protein